MLRTTADLRQRTGMTVVTALRAPLNHAYGVWRPHRLPITLEPEDVFWARIFYGLVHDGYEVMFEQVHDRVRPET